MFFIYDNPVYGCGFVSMGLFFSFVRIPAVAPSPLAIWPGIRILQSCFWSSGLRYILARVLNIRERHQILERGTCSGDVQAFE